MMKNLQIICSAGLIVLSASQSLMAEEETQKPSLEAAAELGFVRTSGNSETEILNAKFDAAISHDKWKHSLHLEALNGSSNDERSAERYFARAQSDWEISNRSYLLGVAIWEKDRFSGFDYQSTVALGYGYKAVNDDSMKLNFEVAPGYRVNKLETGAKEEEAILRLVENFSWTLSETSTLSQLLSTEAADSNTITRFGIFLTSQVAGDLSMKLGHTIKHSTDVPPDADKTDHESSVTLVYKI